jgi:hypothetical protein
MVIRAIAGIVPMTMIMPERERDDEQHEIDDADLKRAMELTHGKSWWSLTPEQRQNRLDTLDPGIKPGGIRDRLMRGIK